jgi:hypothetical protein
VFEQSGGERCTLGLRPGGDDFIRAKDLIERYAGPAVADVKVNKGFKLPVAV